MKFIKFTAILSALVLSIGSAVSCGKKNNKTSSDTPAETTSADSTVVSDENNSSDESSADVSAETTSAEISADTNIDLSVSGDNYDTEKYSEIVKQRVEASANSSEPLSLGSVGELITPAEDDDESDLGSYCISDDGVKLYYEPDEYPTELVLTLKNYFQALASCDYGKYAQCVYPSYIEEMNKYLTEDFEYDLKTSFASQCSSLAANTYGDFTVTRVKIETAPRYNEDIENVESYFSMLDDSFGKDYYGEVKSEADKIYDAVFYVMAEDYSGEETLLISEYEIVFAEKDGKYYLFG